MLIRRITDSWTGVGLAGPRQVQPLGHVGVQILMESIQVEHAGHVPGNSRGEPAGIGAAQGARGEQVRAGHVGRAQQDAELNKVRGKPVMRSWNLPSGRRNWRSADTISRR